MAGTELNGIGIDIENKSFEVSASSSQLDSWSLGCDITIEDMDADIQEIRVNDITMSGNITTEEISVDIESTEVKAMDLAVGFVFGSLGSSLGGNVVDGLDDIKDSIADINDAIQDISKESANIKVTINGIQSQVNDIGTELTNKASVETVVEIGEQITEVQTNVAEQTIRVNSLEAEISTKASAESVTQIADELAITNESLAEQVIKVTDLTAEVNTKASSEMVTEIADDLKITNDTLAEQTLKVDALSSEISTKASAESVADIAGELAITNKSVAEQTIKVSALESEIATKASSESVLTLEGGVAAVEKAVAEQTIKVEGLEASIESKVSKEEFNEKTGELDTKYTNLKQTADNLTIEVGEQGESLTKVIADVNGLSVRVDDIGEAQANYDNTLSELTDILSPEEMSAQIGKGVVLSTIIATRDTDGNITAGMNASSVHSDPVHGRVVFAGGVKNKTDWTNATGILYEDGHIVMNSGEFGENVKIGNAMFRAVLEGDFDLFSYPENGTLVPLFQVNKDSSGKIVSISTPYDFTVNRNLVVFGDTSSGGEGGSSSVGIQGIKLNGTTYRDENSDGIIDLGTIGGGTLTEITYEMIVEALGYTPVSSASLGSLAYKNGLTASDIPDLSGIYLLKTGGILDGSLQIGKDDNTAYNYLRLVREGYEMYVNCNAYGGYISYGAIGASTAQLRLLSDSITFNGNTLYHTGNFNPANYLPLAGGTMKGSLNFNAGLSIKSANTTVLEMYSGVDTYLRGSSHIYLSTPSLYYQDATNTLRTIIHSGNYSSYALPLSGGTINSNTYDILVLDTSYAYGDARIHLKVNGESKSLFGWSSTFGTMIYNSTNGYVLGIKDDGTPYYNSNTLIHSGNVGEYAIKVDASKGESTASADAGNIVGYGNDAYDTWKFSGPVLSFGNFGYYGQFQKRYNSEELCFRSNINGTKSAWKTIAFTDSDITGNAAKLKSPSGLGYANADGSSVLFGYTTSQAAMNTYLDGYNLYLRYGTGHSTGLILNSSGNVTIGSSDLAGTSAKLYVDGIIKATEVSARALTHYESGGYGCHIGDGYYSVGTAEHGACVYTYGARPVYFYTNGSEKMRIAGNGNVLIGTTTDAGYKLDVNGTAAVGNNIDGGDLLVFHMDRVWRFQQAGTGAASALVLRTLENSKWFYLRNSVNESALGFFASSGLNKLYAYCPVEMQSGLSVSGAVTMASTLSIGGYMTFNNGDIMYARDEGGTLRYIMGLTSVLSLGYESASAGIDTHIYGNSIHLHHGTSRGTGLSLYSDGSSQLHGNTTINGNLVVTGDISA